MLTSSTSLKRKALALAVCLASMAVAAEEAPSGPLTVHPKNPRYLANAVGNAIYLTGSHVWTSNLDYERHAPMDFDAYLDFLESHGHNFIRGWANENSSSHVPNVKELVWWSPAMYARPGPDLALDGKPKYDITKADPAFLERIRSRAVEAGHRGFYISIMLFQGWSIGKDDKAGWNSWVGHPFNRDNNINGIDGDPNNDGNGREVHTLEIPEILKIQERHVRRMIDGLNDLDHIVWEISNESPVSSTKWQYHMIRFIKACEAKKPKQHLVWMNAYGQDFPEQALWDSPADIISPDRFDTPSYRWGAPPNKGDKVVILDTDHLWGVGGSVRFVWANFTRGYHPIFMDPYYVRHEKHKPMDPKWIAIRKAMGHTLSYAKRLDMNKTIPNASRDLCSTGHCLENRGRQYLIYQPEPGKHFQARLAAGQYAYELFSPEAGRVGEAGVVKVDGKSKPYANVFEGTAVLFLEKE